MDLSAGSLDAPALLPPTWQFGVESPLAGWHGEDGLPGARLDQHAPIQQRWRSAYGAGVRPGLQATRAAGTIDASPSPKTKDTG